MKLTLSLLAFLVSSNLFAQRNAFSDSMSVEVCKTFNNSNEIPDSLKVEYSFYMHAEAFTSRFDSVEGEKMFNAVFLQMQKTCPGFLQLLEKMTPNETGWSLVEEAPAITASAKECKEMFSAKNLRYIEADGSTTKLELSDKFWIDRFADGSYSKLSLKKDGDCGFTISFLESTNTVRLSLSKKGDTYKYKIISKEGNYYNMYLEVPGTDIKAVFKIYFD